MAVQRAQFTLWWTRVLGVMDKEREADVWGRTRVADKLDRAFAVGGGRCVSVMPLCRRQFLAGI